MHEQLIKQFDHQVISHLVETAFGLFGCSSFNHTWDGRSPYSALPKCRPPTAKGFGSHEKPELETQPSTCRILDRLLPCPSKATFLAVSDGTRGTSTT